MDLLLEDIISTSFEKERIIHYLTKISTTSEFGIYYGSKHSVSELKDRLLDIEKLVKKALNEA